MSTQQMAANRHSRDEESIYNLASLEQVLAAPKVKTYKIQAPSGQSSIRMHQDSSQIQNIFNPVKGPRDAMIRAGIKPPNHAKKNVTAVKEQSKLNALKNLQEQEENSCTRSSKQTPPPIRRSSHSDSACEADRPSTSQTASSSSRNFVLENKICAGSSSVRRNRSSSDGGSTAAGAAGAGHKDFGKVPQYLIKRKLELAQAQAEVQDAKEKAWIPAGMRILSEEERQETLSVLAANRAETERQLQALPIVIETIGLKRRQDELVRRLQEIDEANKVFSRPTVLVHM